MDNQTHCDNFQTESSYGGGCFNMDQGGHDQQFDPAMADLSNMMQHTQLTAGGDSGFGGHNSGGLSLLWRTRRRTFASCDIAIEHDL